MSRTLVVWCPDWPTVAAGACSDVPAAVFHANRVVACTAAARSEGVTRTMRRREAQSRCPSLIVLPHDPVRDAREFEPVVTAVGTLTPHIEITRPGSCAFPTRGPSRYFGGDLGLADRVRAVCPVACQVGIADSPFAALLAARRDMVVPVGSTASFLAPLSIHLLDDPTLTDLLSRLGIRTLGAFATLSADDVAGRFGMLGSLAHRRARGLSDRSLECSPLPPDFDVEMVLDPPADNAETVAFAAKTLADDLCTRLAASGRACTCISIEASSDDSSVSRTWRHESAFSGVSIAERVRWQLSAFDGCVSVVRLSPVETVTDRGRQRGFWGEKTEADHRAARGFARVQGLLGPSAVMTAVLGGGRGPGERVVMVPWGSPRPLAAPGSWPGRIPSPSPSLVFASPVGASVVSLSGEVIGVTGRSLITAPPARVSIDGGSWSSVESWAGPWTADERWWDPPAHRRSARLQVVLEDGMAHLLVLRDGRWWVEGTYD